MARVENEAETRLRKPFGESPSLREETEDDRVWYWSIAIDSRDARRELVTVGL